jgi:galactose-inhibitable lectin light subunit
MIVSYVYPKRVHDIRGGANVNSRLIIWEKKDPLAPTTNNQRFNYVRDYPYMTEKWMQYRKHFYLPFNTAMDMCYEAALDFQTWEGNKNNKYSTDVYQIKAAKCNNSEPKQIFTLIFL